MTDTDILAFLKARLDEDERIARAASKHSADWREDSSWLTDMLDPPPHQRRERPSGWLPMIDPEDIVHIALHDPSRVLREVAAKRTVLSMIEEIRRMEGCIESEWGGSEEVADPLLRSMAAIWADHPDYNPSWTVET